MFKNKFALLLFCFIITFSLKNNVFSEEKTIHLKNYSFKLSHKSIYQGDTLSLFIDSKHTLKRLKVSCFQKELQPYKIYNKIKPHLFRTFIPTSATDKPGKYKIKIKATNIYGRTERFYVVFHIKKKKFPTQYIKVPKKKKKDLTRKQLSNEARIFGAKLRSEYNRRHIAGTFITPVKGIVTSVFGAQRKYNTGRLAWYHKGLDIANKTGTPIKAANSGIVMLAQNFTIHGKSVIIDHGYGVKTLYNHLNSINVKSKQIIKKGDVIGYVGTTGISTGPHLHFGVSVFNVRVNPDQWIKGKVKLYY